MEVKNMPGPYIKIKVKDDRFEIGTVEEWNGPDAIEECIRYLREKYGFSQKAPEAVTSAK